MSPRRVSPVKKRSKLAPALLGMAIVVMGFFTLLVRLEVIEEGYRISAERAALARLEDENRRLQLQAAELGSHERLRALAPKYHLEPAHAGQVVLVP